MAKSEAAKESTSEKKESFWQGMRIFRYLGPYRGWFFSAVILSLISTAFGLMFPYLVGQLLDAALPSAKAVAGTGWKPGINAVALLLLACLGAQAALAFVATWWFHRSGEMAVVDLRKEVYGRMVALPMTFFGERRVGELSSRLSTDLTQIQETFTGTISQALRQVTLLLGGVAFIAFTSWRLSLVMISSFPVLLLVAVVFGRGIRKRSREAQDRLAESATVVEETLQGIANVKAFGNERFEALRYGATLDGFLAVTLKTIKLRAALVSFIIFGIFGAIVLVLWYGARLMQEGQLTHGELLRFILYTTFVGGAVVSFADVFSTLQKTLGASQRVRELLGEKPETVLSVANPLRLRGDVEFDAVDFRYPSRPEMAVLRGLSLTAKAGTKIALVGPSGAGKSTVVSLLLRYYEPDSGRVLVDGRPASEFDLATLRASMAVVPQEVLLFGGTIRENIAYGRPEASEEEIIEAARRANCDDFIRKFPEGYDTIVGERGIKVSGGQRQRIAIARALLKNPSILILDEATSSLDSESEHLVQEALDTLMDGRTSVIIAHRLATVRKVDAIFVVQEGQVVESGTHEDLMQVEGGLYRKLSTMQFVDVES